MLAVVNKVRVVPAVSVPEDWIIPLALLLEHVIGSFITIPSRLNSTKFFFIVR